MGYYYTVITDRFFICCIGFFI